MTVIQTYHTMLAQIQHIVPTGHLYRQRLLAWFMTGIYHGRTVAFGSAVMKRGDLSIFRIGYDMLERCLINNLPISLRLAPFFT